MPKNAPISPEGHDGIEDLQLPPENDVVFINDNTEMAGPVAQSDTPPLDSDAVRQFGDVDQNFELPPPPLVVNVAKPSDDQPAVLWFDYKTSHGLDNTPVISWEVKRYKLNKDGRWSFKSSKVFQEKENDKKTTARKLHMEELTLEIQYRFTVSATNACGKGRASKSSNIICVGATLPNGWFRTKQSNKVKAHVGTGSAESESESYLKDSAQHRLTTSEAANPITNMSSFSFIYYNLHTGQAAVHPPAVSDPYFLENLDVVNLFNSTEMAKLREIYDEEILHYDKVSKLRMSYILLEVGERIHPNKIKNVIAEIAPTEHFVSTFPEFMDVMYTFKIRSLSMSTIVAAAGSLFSCIGSAVVTYGLIETMGNWNIFLSKLLNRKQFVNRRTKQKTCNMPLEIRLSLTDDDAVYKKAAEKFNPFEMEIIKLTFLHLDCNHCGEISAVEMYRYFLISCADTTTLANKKILSPAMLKQRKKLYGSITVLTSKRILSFKCFNQLLLVLQAKDKQGFRSKYKELLGVMSTLATFKPSRSYLLQALDKYLLVKKQKIYERGKELLETIATNTPPPPPSAMEEEEEERKKRNPFAKANADQYLTEDSDDGMRVKHAPCCFCGCREKEGSSGPPL